MKSYLYVLGTEPYDNSHGDYHSKGNGEWHATAPNIEEALKVIFSSMPFPSEPTGRKFFMDGVSLAGVSDCDIIQVWSNEPEIIARTNKLTRESGIDKQNRSSGLHNGRGQNFGLHLELKVTDIENYLAPARALLMAPAPDPSTTTGTISPMGASLLKFDDMKHEMQAAIQREQMEIARREWEMESVAEEMEGKVGLLNQQIGVLNTYLHGTRHRAQISTGKRGTGKYHVFQNRQFLSEEIALLANFDDFDFKKLEDLEQWLLKSGRIWKFLPFERCILATRIRQERKDYGDPLANLFNNYENMRNMIWVRDGENVCHVDVDFDFHNAIFPDRNQYDRALQVCLNYIWRKAFKWSKPKNWHGETLKPGEYDVMGQMRRKPLDEEEPYFTNKSIKERFHTLEAWLESEFYTDVLDRQIKEAVEEYLRQVNRRQMVFAVLLQGIVDNTQLLEIPKGTDLFNWESIDRYFTLLHDYSQALTWKGVTNKVAPYLDEKATRGDWIVAIVDEYIPPPPEDKSYHSYRHGKTYKESRPVLFQVVDLKEVEIEKYVGDPGERKKFKVVRPVVNYHPIATRHRRGDDYGVRRRVNAPIKLILKNSSFIKVPMPPSLAEQILDDRNWKRDHKWAVPLMVNYKKIIAAVKKQVNCTILKWDNFDD